MKDLSKKEEYIKSFAEKLNKAQIVVLTGCEGVTVTEMTGLRKAVRESGSEMRVVKNTLICRALKGTQMAELEKHMKGSTAVTFGYDDAIAPIKALYSCVSKAPKLVFKAGFMEGRMLEPQELETLSKLPSRKELYSMLASAVQGPIRKLACIIDALREKREKEAAPAAAEAAPAAV